MSQEKSLTPTDIEHIRKEYIDLLQQAYEKYLGRFSLSNQ